MSEQAMGKKNVISCGGGEQVGTTMELFSTCL